LFYLLVNYICIAIWYSPLYTHTHIFFFFETETHYAPQAPQGSSSPPASVSRVARIRYHCTRSISLPPIILAVFVTFVSLWSKRLREQLERGKIYFGSQFQEFWSLVLGSVDSGPLWGRTSWMQESVAEEASPHGG
jgi:hypothetical protein